MRVVRKSSRFMLSAKRYAVGSFVLVASLSFLGCLSIGNRSERDDSMPELIQPVPIGHAPNSFGYTKLPAGINVDQEFTDIVTYEAIVKSNRDLMNLGVGEKERVGIINRQLGIIKERRERLGIVADMAHSLIRELEPTEDKKLFSMLSRIEMSAIESLNSKDVGQLNGSFGQLSDYIAMNRIDLRDNGKIDSLYQNIKRLNELSSVNSLELR